MYKTTIQHQIAARDIAASAAEFAAQVNDGLARRWAPALQPDETAPDFLFAQELVGRLLASANANLAELGEEQTHELVLTADLREQRDQLADQLRDFLRDARNLLDAALDSAGARVALPVRRLSNMSPPFLVQAARQVVDTLRDPRLDFAGRPNSIYEVPKMIAALEGTAGELEALLERLAQQARKNQNELGAKLAGVENAADLNRRCGDFLFGLYRLAGLDFHADRLRPGRG